MTVGVLGPLELTVRGRPVTVTSGRLRTLLVVLALSAGEVVSFEAIGDRIWGAHPPHHLRRTVQTWMARLRQVLGPDLIGSGPDGYLLRIPPDHVDALRLLRLFDSAAGAAGVAGISGGAGASGTSGAADGAERGLIDEALGLWRGTPFDGVASRWLADAETPRLVERYLSALERVVDLDIEVGEYDAHVSRLRTEIARHPLRESLWTRLLVVLDRSGRPAEALEQYERVRVRIADELGVDPGPDLRRIHAELLERDAHGPPSTATMPTLAAPTSRRPHQLPSDIERFTGRSEALAALDALLPLGDAAARPIVIAAVDGLGGIGKTTLAVHWAHRVRDRFPDGQLFVDLRGFGPGTPVEPAAALDILLRGLGLANEQIPNDVDARSALLRTTLAERRVLVVLDNARDSEQVRPLLPGSSSLVVVTSRSQLRGLAAREGAHRVSLGQFASPESAALLAATFGVRRVPYDTQTLTELADLCGHLPLALVIAAEYAARQPETGLRDLTGKLRDEPNRLDALDVGDDRASNLRGVFSWSYAALDAEAARLFRLLAGQPAADFSAELAGAVAGVDGEPVRRTLDRLVGVHLLQQSRAGRYQFHDLIRAYAAERSEREDDSGVRDEALGRCLDWYLHTLFNAAEIIRPSRQSTPHEHFAHSTAAPLEFGDRASALRWCHAERRALLVTVQHAYDRGRFSHAWRLAWQLHRFLDLAEFADDVVVTAEVGMAAAAHLDDRARYVAATHLGNAYGRGWRDRDAIRTLREALGHAQACGDLGAEAVVLLDLATAVHNDGDVDAAQTYYQRAMDVTARWEGRDGDASLLSPNVAAILAHLGDSLIEMGRHEDAIDRIEHALAEARRDGNHLVEGMCLGSLAQAYEAVGILRRAEEYCVEGLAILRELGSRDRLVNTLLTYARIMAATDRPEDVHSACAEGLALLGAAEDRRVDELQALLAPTGC